MPGGLVGDEFAGLIANHSEHDHPGKHFGIADHVELLGSQIQQRFVVALFHLGDGPVIEFKIRCADISTCRESATFRRWRSPRRAPAGRQSLWRWLFQAAAQRRAVGSGGK